VSAWLASTFLAWSLATASGQSLPTISASDLTSKRCMGFDALRMVLMRIFKISPCTWCRWSLGKRKCFLIWWRDERLSVAICEWPWRIAVVMAASSALPMVFAMSISFGSTKLGVGVLGWYVPATVFVFLDKSDSCRPCKPTSSS